MSRRFRPFYVAALAVVLVGLYGTETVPKSHGTSAPENSPVQSTDTVQVDGGSGWLGPQVKAATGLLDLTTSFSILPFDVAN